VPACGTDKYENPTLIPTVFAHIKPLPSVAAAPLSTDVSCARAPGEATIAAAANKTTMRPFTISTPLVWLRESAKA
jgi:hypothetical protein